MYIYENSGFRENTFITKVKTSSVVGSIFPQYFDSLYCGHDHANYIYFHLALNHSVLNLKTSVTNDPDPGLSSI